MIIIYQMQRYWHEDDTAPGHSICQYLGWQFYHDWFITLLSLASMQKLQRNPDRISVNVSYIVQQHVTSLCCLELSAVKLRQRHPLLIYISLTCKNNKAFNKMIFSCKRVCTVKILAFISRLLGRFCLTNDGGRPNPFVIFFFFSIYLCWIGPVYSPKPKTVSITVDYMESEELNK